MSSAVQVPRLPAARRTLAPPGFPLYAYLLLLPLWWALGLGNFIWPLLAFPLVLALLARGEILVAPRFGLWLLFVAWMLLSAFELDSPDRILAFSYRGAIYLSATVLFLWLLNTSPEVLPDRAILAALTGLWLLVVLGGFLGILFPHVAFATLTERVLPAGLANDDFIRQLVHPSLADVDDFLGYPLPRPKTFFPYANAWGATLAVLTPFALASLRAAHSPLVRRGLQVSLLLAVVPLVFSLNRGAWLALAIALAYASIRLALRRNLGAVAGLLAFVAALAVLLLATPLGNVVHDRFAHPHSNAGRERLYEESVSRVVTESPLLGFGAPRPSERGGYLPSVGTQSQASLLLFSHGIPGLALFLAWFGYLVLRSRRPGKREDESRARLRFWAHVSLLVFLVETAYYEMIPLPLHVAMIAGALVLRPEVARLPSPRSR
ncbi:MAG: O-antigen ligase family protein [Actinomycetota bacterium]|nr:O-antigen ligase family protein [Actinomycetota bacterium]